VCWRVGHRRRFVRSGAEVGTCGRHPVPDGLARLCGSAGPLIDFRSATGTVWPTPCRSLGIAQHATGDHPAAGNTLEHALTLFHEVADPDGEAETLNHIDQLLLDTATPAATCQKSSGAQVRIMSSLTKTKIMPQTQRPSIRDTL
jgi:hypothetical protein